MARYEEDLEERRIPREVMMTILGVIAFICLVIILIILFGSWYTISAGYRGVILTWGNPSPIAVSEGFHLKIPIAQKVIKMDTRTQKYEAELTAASKDLQDVSTKIAINYRASADSVVDIYKTIGIDYADKVIFPLEQESNKAATALYTAEELITKREEVRTEMERILKEKLAPRGIVVESISIVDFKFSPSFSQAIENKVTQEQNALAEKNKLQAVEFQAQQRIAQAEGEAKAIQIQVDAINQKGGENYIALKSVEAWDGKLPIVMGSGSVPFIDMRNLGSPIAATGGSLLVSNETK